MPTKNKNATEQTLDNHTDKIHDTLSHAVVNNQIFITCGVNRRINLGNFEHLDIYAGVAAPVDTDFEAAATDISNQIAEAMKIASAETNERYQKIKQAQAEANGR